MKCFGWPILTFNRLFTPARLTKSFGVAPVRASVPIPMPGSTRSIRRSLAVIEARKARTDAGCEVEYRIVRPDGVVRRIRDLAFPVRDAAGRVIRMAGVAEDVD